MPIYEFLCRDCDTRFDDLVSMSDAHGVTCASCRSADVVRLYSPFAVHSRASSAATATAGACGAGACLPGPAAASAGGGCCGGGCGGCG